MNKKPVKLYDVKIYPQKTTEKSEINSKFSAEKTITKKLRNSLVFPPNRSHDLMQQRQKIYFYTLAVEQTFNFRTKITSTRDQGCGKNRSTSSLKKKISHKR